ncbi:MAG: hypothetical protein ACLFNZ_09300 [Spirochaetaceae bacterium]
MKNAQYFISPASIYKIDSHCLSPGFMVYLLSVVEGGEPEKMAESMNFLGTGKYWK